LIIANGLTACISAPFWGYLGNISTRLFIAGAAAGAGLLGLFTTAAATLDRHPATSQLGLALVFLVLNVMHSGVRLGRKLHLVDMAGGYNRAAYVAVSRALIGVLMLVLAGGWSGIGSERQRPLLCRG
jgi:hypothetical protein